VTDAPSKQRKVFARLLPINPSNFHLIFITVATNTGLSRSLKNLIGFTGSVTTVIR
jgi:hypothetical protein